MRLVLNSEVRRLIPCTSYPFDNKSSARYAPSCPVTPVMRARFIFVWHSLELLPRLVQTKMIDIEQGRFFADQLERERSRPANTRIAHSGIACRRRAANRPRARCLTIASAP